LARDLVREFFGGSLLFNEKYGSDSQVIYQAIFWNKLVNGFPGRGWLTESISLTGGNMNDSFLSCYIYCIINFSFKMYNL